MKKNARPQSRREIIENAANQVERLVLSTATYNRATCVEFTAAYLTKCLGGLNMSILEDMWQLLRRRPPPRVVAVDPPSFPRDDEKGRFYLNARYPTTEATIQAFLEQAVKAKLVVLLHVSAMEWLLSPQKSAALIAERITDRAIETCAVITPTEDRAREKMIRDRVAAILTTRGASPTIASTFPIVTLDNIVILKGAERWNIILDRAHEMGTLQHMVWIEWILSLHRTNPSQAPEAVELVVPQSLGWITLGYSVTFHLCPPDSPAALLHLARQILAAVKVSSVPESQWKLAARGGTRLVVSRLYNGQERTAAHAFVGSTPVQHCSFFGDFPTRVRACRERNENGIVVLREAVAAKFKLHDWLFLLSLLVHPRMSLLLVHGEGAMTVDKYLEDARPLIQPLLTCGRGEGEAQ